MYKNISFQEAEFGEKKFLMYRVDDAAQMDHVEVEMLKNNDIKGLLPFSSAQNNDEIRFMYEMTNKMKLSQFLGGLVRWEELYPAVQGIVAAVMDCEQYMLNEGHFVLETENIFIDLSSRKIELMFLPVENELLAQITWKDFLITLLHNLNYDMKDDIGKLETLQSYLTDEKITIKEYAEKIEKIETLGLARNKDVKKENRQSERPVREVKREEKPNVIYNVPDPNSEVSPGVMKTEKGEKKEGIIGLFSKKKKKEKKNPPLLFNLAELQNTCSKLFKISPDETLKIVQELYEKKLVTYPRTDARVLSTAVAKEIHKNISGLRNYALVRDIASGILEAQSYKGIEKTKYVNDKQITDHYAIIPTGQGFNALNSVTQTAARVYEVIVRRFLCIFYPSAEYLKINITAERLKESFFASFKIMTKEGYLAIASASFAKQKLTDKQAQTTEGSADDAADNDNKLDKNAIEKIKQLKKGMEIDLFSAEIKEGETSPPKRYNSGSMILAMENAGQLIEDEDLRAQIKGSGIGTSATRAEILSKLVNIKYLSLNKKTQIITPTLLGEMIYDVVFASIHALLNPELTASWELGLTMVADGKITEEEYMMKLNSFITNHVQNVKSKNYQNLFKPYFDKAAANYKTSKKTAKKTTAKSGTDNSKTKNKQA